MCDCYMAKCAGCGRGVPMHLGDFDTGRDEVDVFCCRCKGKVPFGVVKMVWSQPYGPNNNQAWKIRRGHITVVSKTLNALSHALDNYPNLFSWEIHQNMCDLDADAIRRLVEADTVERKRTRKGK